MGVWQSPEAVQNEVKFGCFSPPGIAWARQSHRALQQPALSTPQSASCQHQPCSCTLSTEKWLQHTNKPTNVVFYPGK